MCTLNTFETLDSLVYVIVHASLVNNANNFISFCKTELVLLGPIYSAAVPLWQFNVILFSYLPSVTCFGSISLLAIDEVKMVVWQLQPTPVFQIIGLHSCYRIL